jgi:hypothetical protein
MAKTATAEAVEHATGRTLVKNPEAVAIDKIATILEPLGKAQRRRILAWANEVYGNPEETGIDPFKPA